MPIQSPQAGAAGDPGESEEEEGVLRALGAFSSAILQDAGEVPHEEDPTRRGGVVQFSAPVGTSDFAASALAQAPNPTPHRTVLERSTGERWGSEEDTPGLEPPLPLPLARRPWPSSWRRHLRSDQTGSDPAERLKWRRAPWAQGQVHQTPAGPAPCPSPHPPRACPCPRGGKTLVSKDRAPGRKAWPWSPDMD